MKLLAKIKVKYMNGDYDFTDNWYYFLRTDEVLIVFDVRLKKNDIAYVFFWDQIKSYTIKEVVNEDDPQTWWSKL